MQRIRRSTLAVLLLVALLCSSIVPAYAQDATPDAPDAPDVTNQLFLPAVIADGAQDDVDAAGGFPWQQPPFKGDRMVSVMTRNLYLGADLAPLLTAGSQEEFVAAVTTVYLQAMASAAPGRMNAVANEIAKEKPLLIGLQEVTTLSRGAAAFPAPASEVQFDYLELLLGYLAQKGLKYEPVVIVPGFDAQAPGLLPVGGQPALVNVRLSVRDVLLARSDLKTADLKLSNPQGANYTTFLSLPTPIGLIPFPRQWASVDVKIRGKSFRFITTHLESFDQTVRVAQAQELLTGPAATSLPTIAVGDFNSQPGVTGDAAANIIAAGFTDVWGATNPRDPGFTCCQDGSLRNLVSIATERIDLVLARGFDVNRHTATASLTGTRRLNLPPIPPELPPVRWASDHFGVFASLQVPR